MPHAPFMLAESGSAENPVKLLVVLLWFVILAVGGIAKFLSAQKKSDAEEEDEPAGAAPFPPQEAAPARNAVPEAPEDAFAAMLREELLRQKERARERRLEEMRARRARAEKARTEKKPVPAAACEAAPPPSSAGTPPAPAAPARRKTSAPAADLLGSREALRRAVLAQEILSPPLALRER